MDPRLTLVKTEKTEPDFVELPEFVQMARAKIDEMDQYCQAKGSLGGVDCGFETFNHALEGLQTGLTLIGGQSNIGKSALCLQLAWQVAKSNQTVNREKPYKTYVLYFSLDDNAKDLMPRIVSIEEGLDINIIKNPAKYADKADLLVKRKRGINTLYESTNCFRMLDTLDGDSIEFIAEQIRYHKTELTKIADNYKLVIFIDNFYDITVRTQNFGDNTKARAEYVATELEKLCTLYDVPIVCTAEFRKLNGIRRPILDDIKDAGKVVYKAKAIILCYQEVHLRGEAANIYWTDPTKIEKQPVLECHFAKNKFSSYKGRVFFNFISARSTMIEVPKEGANRYQNMLA